MGSMGVEPICWPHLEHHWPWHLTLTPSLHPHLYFDAPSHLPFIHTFTLIPPHTSPWSTPSLWRILHLPFVMSTSLTYLNALLNVLFSLSADEGLRGRNVLNWISCLLRYPARKPVHLCPPFWCAHMHVNSDRTNTHPILMQNHTWALCRQHHTWAPWI